MDRFSLDTFLRELQLAKDPTGGVWASARASVMQMQADHEGDTELPIIDVMALPADFPRFDLPEQCSPLDGAEGEPWALLEVIPPPEKMPQLQKFATRNEFTQQWDAISLGFLKEVDFKAHRAVVAGGAVETCLQSLEGFTVENNIKSGGRGSGDIDIFFHGHETWVELTDDIKNVALQVIRGMKQAGANHVVVERTEGTIKLVASKFSETHRGNINFGRPVQLILESEYEIGYVLAMFDLDSVQYAYDGETVWATPLALRSRVFGANVIDVERILAGSAEQTTRYGNGLRSGFRMSKYADRGYAVAVPMGQQSLVLAQAMVRDIESDPDKVPMEGLGHLLNHDKFDFDDATDPRMWSILQVPGAKVTPRIIDNLETILKLGTRLLLPWEAWEPQTSALGYQAAWVEGTIPQESSSEDSYSDDESYDE